MGNWFATVIGMRPLARAPGNALVGGVQGAVSTIPAGHSAGFLLCATRGQGINAAVARWGDVLRAKYAAPKVKPTVVSTTLGYCKSSRYCWHLGCILPRAPAISLRTGDACYKIKTTCVGRYAVLPWQALIPAGQSVEVEIVLIKMDKLPG